MSRIFKLPDYSHITPLEWAYFAGLLDGEGSINIANMNASDPRKQRAVRVTISQSDPRLILWIKERWGGHATRNGGFNRPCFNWTMTGFGVTLILNAVRPFLLVKGEQADIAMAYRETMNWNKSVGDRGRTIPDEVLATRQNLEAKMRDLKPHRRSGSDASKLVAQIQ